MKVKSSRIFRPGNRFLVPYLAFLSAFAPISTDMYLPALPSMAENLGTSNELVSASISMFMLVFAFSMLAWGSLSDRYGRRPALFAGALIYIISSVGIAFCNSIMPLLSWRCVQAVGSGAATSLSMAIVKDIMKGDRMEKVISLMQATLIIAPLTAPVLGGWMLALVSWRGIFWCLALCGLFAMLGVFCLAETAPQKQNRLDCRNFCKNGRGFGQKRIFKALAVVFRNVNALYVLSGNILFYLSGRFWRFGAGIQPVFRLQCLFLAYGAAIPFVFAAAFAQEHGNLRPSRVNERGGNYAACPGRQGALVFRPALCANMLLRKRAPSTLHHADDAVNKRGQRHCRLANQLRRPAFRQSFDVHRLACNLAQSNTCGRLHCRHRFGNMPCLLAENQKRLLISGKRKIN